MIDQAKLSAVKAACRKMIELDAKRTQGAWTSTHGDSYDAYPSVRNANGHFILYDAMHVDKATAEQDLAFPGADADASFIAAASTHLALLAQSTLAAVEAAELVAVKKGGHYYPRCDCGKCLSVRIINNILANFPDELLAKEKEL
jgi:hypothetical protein